MDINTLIQQTNRLTCSSEPIELETDRTLPDILTPLTIVGKIICDIPFNKSTVRKILFKAWSSPSGLKIKEQDNHLLFIFQNEADYHKVLNNRPWTVMGSHLAIREWLPDVALQEVNLSTSPFWVRVYGLPPNRMTSNNAITIEKIIGVLLQVEHSRNCRIGEAAFMRLRVEIALEQPVPKGFALKR
ncbi:hypothetical protein RJ639_006678 [Escallonia herrerae]|uniref:DUF4283 domain-containing protein n=1 Tax=Escallonia herrerae TaxID=1293975 RepID=A0AA88VXP0_9ASTE|nr:hypothetical protein RJ639_006678 [Escallonia herrerae]